MAPCPPPPAFVPLHWVRRAVLMLDLVESVQLIEQHPETTIQRWLQFERRVVQDLLPALAGRLVKSLGDGMLLEFTHAQAAALAALQLHEALLEANQGDKSSARLRARIGVDVGDVVIGERDDLGHPVNVAARLASAAPPEGTLLSSAARDELVPGLDGDIEDLGELFLKHVREPVRAFALNAHQTLPQSAPRSPANGLAARIAILPLDDRAVDASLPMLGDAIADELVHCLSSQPQLAVISRLSTASFRARAVEPAQLRESLRADLALSGRVRTNGSGLRLHVELMEVRSAEVIWTHQIDTQAQELFNDHVAPLQTLCALLVEALAQHQVQRVRRLPMAALENYCLLMAAIKLLHSNVRSDFERAQLVLEHLIERERRHPAALGWLAKWHVLRVQQGWDDERQRDIHLARDCTARALDLDPHSSLNLAIDGFVQCNLLRNVDQGIERQELALSLNPNESLAWLFLGTARAFRGEGEAAMQATQQALDLSPLDPMRYFYESLSATAALAAKRWDLAIARAQHSLRLNRRHTSTLRALTIAQVYSGQIEAARESAATLLRLEPQLTITRYLERSPSAAYETGKLWSAALAEAGVPQA